MSDLSWSEAKGLLLKALKQAGIEWLLGKNWPLLVRYGEALEEAASNLNLTAVKTRRERVLTQFLESLVLASKLPKSGSAADLGTGAGIPGLVVKLARPGLEITLLEALPSRVEFMNQMIQELGLKGVRAKVVHLGQDPWPGPFDLVFARGYGAVRKFTLHAAKCLRPGGRAFYLWRKGIEPWGEGELALRLLEEQTFSGISSPLLVWEKPGFRNAGRDRSI